MAVRVFPPPHCLSTTHPANDRVVLVHERQHRAFTPDTGRLHQATSDRKDRVHYNTSLKVSFSDPAEVEFLVRPGR
ncbi:MAG: hypothetical protein HY647_09345 [Acidobacteria bacterium]|nr:hypothetical protein [Acidobacteriota bacterium]